MCSKASCLFQKEIGAYAAIHTRYVNSRSLCYRRVLSIIPLPRACRASGAGCWWAGVLGNLIT